MTNKTISALSSASTIVGTEVLPIVQSSATVKVSVANLTSGLGTIIATKGGTGQTSYAVGDLLYADTTTTLAKLPDVATGNALISGGVSTAPSWGKIGLTTHVSGVLPVANGGTNASTASITSFNNITGYSASGATGTTTTNLVFSTSPSITNTTLVGNATLSTGNVVISISGKGVTTGSAINLGLGTNGNTTQASIDTSGNLLVGTTSTPSGALANGMIGQKGSAWDANHFGGFTSGVAVQVSKTASIGGFAFITGYSATGGYNAIVLFQTGVVPTVVSVANTLGSVVSYTVVGSALYITNTGTAATLFLEANVMTMTY